MGGAYFYLVSGFDESGEGTLGAPQGSMIGGSRDLKRSGLRKLSA